jgi:hypothetical protein
MSMPISVNFFDKQDPHNPSNGEKIHEVTRLDDVLDDLRKREPSIYELIGSCGYDLTIGVAGNVGFVQHSREKGQLPYLMAITTGTDSDDGEVAFLIDDTPTPISLRYILPIDTVKAIAGFFLRTGQRSAAVSWEEI